MTVDEVFERLPSESRTVFLKMDVEGSEYRVLDDVLKHADDIVAMTIEFHEIDDRPNHPARLDYAFEF